MRAALRGLPGYVPGARPSGTAAKLSSNENPHPLPRSVLEAVQAAVGQVNRYPDMAVGELTVALAQRLGVSPESVVTGNGSVALLEHLFRAFCESGDEVVHAWRSFEAYPIALTVSGATGVPVPLDQHARHDLPAMLAAVSPRTRAVLVCTPNNPTGPAVRPDELVALLDALPPQVLVVIDEAYREFAQPGAVDGVALLAQYPNVVVLRTFSKAYGLAGLRVGYAVAHPALAAAIRIAATPFGVNHLAQVAALAALDARAELMERVALIVGERDRVLAGLRAQGWSVPDSEANFVWLPTGARSVELAADAVRHGLVLRPFAGEGIRITVGLPEENDRVLAVTASWR